MQRWESGQTLPEVIITVAILGILAQMVVASTDGMLRRAAARELAMRIKVVLRGVQQNAEMLQSNYGIVFSQAGGEWWYSVYNDTNGNGVLMSDIKSGIDTLVDGPRPLPRAFTMAHVALPPGGFKDPDTGTDYPPGASPIRFGTSAICTFTPDGTSSPGSIYVSAGSTVVVVRCSGAGGNIHVETYSP